MGLHGNEVGDTRLMQDSRPRFDHLVLGRALVDLVGGVVVHAQPLVLRAGLALDHVEGRRGTHRTVLVVGPAPEVGARGRQAPPGNRGGLILAVRPERRQAVGQKLALDVWVPLDDKKGREQRRLARQLEIPDVQL